MSGNSSHPKKIFEPDSADELMRGWLLHAHKGRDRHDLAARSCDRNRILLGGLASILSAVVGTSIFATLGNKPPNSWIAILVATVGILTAILTSLSTFLNLSEQAEKHRSAGVRYKQIIWEIERILSEKPGELKKTDDSVTNVQKLLSDLEANMLIVGQRFFNEIERNYKRVKVVTKADELYGPIHKDLNGS